MFGFSKAASFNNIMAVKDYSKTKSSIEDGTFYVPFSKEIYLELFNNQGAKVDNMKELGKFVKKCKKDKKEVWHFWETLIADGYTLLGVQYSVPTPSLEKLCNCNNDTIKFVCTV